LKVQFSDINVHQHGVYDYSCEARSLFLTCTNFRL
jgi:hypothetical protein